MIRWNRCILNDLNSLTKLYICLTQKKELKSLSNITNLGRQLLNKVNDKTAIIWFLHLVKDDTTSVIDLTLMDI